MHELIQEFRKKEDEERKKERAKMWKNEIDHRVRWYQTYVAMTRKGLPVRFIRPIPVDMLNSLAEFPDLLFLFFKFECSISRGMGSKHERDIEKLNEELAELPDNANVNDLSIWHQVRCQGKVMAMRDEEMTNEVSVGIFRSIMPPLFGEMKKRILDAIVDSTADKRQVTAVEERILKHIIKPDSTLSSDYWELVRMEMDAFPERFKAGNNPGKHQDLLHMCTGGRGKEGVLRIEMSQKRREGTTLVFEEMMMGMGGKSFAGIQWRGLLLRLSSTSCRRTELLWVSYFKWN